MKSKEEYNNAFQSLGNEWDVSLTSLTHLEDYICKLYGSKKSNVNEARYERFMKKYTKENKTIDLSLLPTCRATLSLHISRGNYIACLWKTCTTADIESVPCWRYGWNSSYNIQWYENDPFPDDVTTLLLINDAVNYVGELHPDEVSDESDKD